MLTLLRYTERCSQITVSYAFTKCSFSIIHTKNTSFLTEFEGSTFPSFEKMLNP